MKRVSVVILILCLIVILGACNYNEKNQDEKYSIDATYTYGGDLEKTEISYEVVINGEEKDIKNIKVYQVLINMDYLDLMLENGPHNSQINSEDSSSFKITGMLTFNTKGKSKEEIVEMELLKGIEIIDKENNKTNIMFDY